jgi:uncharacterized protein (UPF0276 family)
VPTLLERDFNFPPVEDLLKEIRRIKELQGAVRTSEVIAETASG